MSYTKAADELSITKSAVSRRIQSLESDLGVRLLRRTNKAFDLTPDGAAYYKITGPAFSALRTAGDALGRQRTNNILRIALPQSFASHWFIPRLPSFYKQHPKIDLHLDSLGYFNSLNADNIDVVLQVAKEPNRSFHAEKFLPLVQFPVCSPAILKGNPVRTLDDLAGHTLLHLNSMPSAWGDWLNFVGRPDLVGARDLHFDTMDLSLEAAASGLGFAMGEEMLCREDIAKGRLAAPFSERLTDNRAMYFVCRKQDVSSRLVRQFRSWLMTEVTR